MQGSGKKGSVSQGAISFSQKKIIEFPVEFSPQKYRRSTSKFSRKAKVIAINRKRSVVRKKLGIVLLNTKSQLHPFFEKEKLIFLITYRRNNFRDKFSPGNLYQCSMKITPSFRSPWASNLPHYLIKIKQD